MTRDELIEKVARIICKEWGYIWDDDEDDAQTAPYLELPYDERPSKVLFKQAATSTIDTIFAALKEPTASMSVAGCEADDPLGGLIDWNGDNCTTREAVNAVWQAMLSASPLAPNNKENK